MTRGTLLALLLATACQPAPPGGVGSTTPGITSVSTPSPGSGETTDIEENSSGESTPASASSDAAGTTTLALDVGADSDDETGRPPLGCHGKIDLLFVVSRATEEMLARQQRLIAAFPQFLAGLEAKFPDLDPHIMVIDADAHWGANICEEPCPAEGCELIPDYPCDLLDVVTECDRTLGAGSVFPAGFSATNQPCDVAGGRRYLTRDQPDLVETFACIAHLGIHSFNWVGEAFVAAIDPLMNFPGACNEGFIRPDALLMVTFLGEDDWAGKPWDSDGGPTLWAEAVLDAKHDDPGAAVMLSLSKSPCKKYYDQICQMTEKFPHHLAYDRDALDYGPAFAGAIDLLEVACPAFSAPE